MPRFDHIALTSTAILIAVILQSSHAVAKLLVAFPDPRVHPVACGRVGLKSSLVCDPSGILTSGGQDKVDMVARSVSSQILSAAVVVMPKANVGAPNSTGSFHCNDAAKHKAERILTSWGNGLTVLILASKDDRQFCIVQQNPKSELVKKEDVDHIYKVVEELLSVQNQVTMDLLDSAIISALLRLWERSTVDKAHAHMKVMRPSNRELMQMFIAQCIPFIGFGITDNGLMIIFGEAIEQFLGKLMGLSTMGAAATGNLLSDIAGIFLGGQVQAIASRLGAAEPDLTLEQRSLTITRTCKQLGETVGITIGCIIGMAPLLYMEKGQPALEVDSPPVSDVSLHGDRPNIMQIKSQDGFSA